MRTSTWITSGTIAGLLAVSGLATAKGFTPGASARLEPLSGLATDEEWPLLLAAAPPAASEDRAFLEQALGVNELELRLGRLAVERTDVPDGKSKAWKMVENHTALKARLGDLARRAGGSADPRMTPEQQETYQRVASQPAASFQRTFEQTVNAGHVKELAMYESEVDRAVDPQLRAFAEERVAALRQAVASAERTARAMPAR